MFWYKRFWNYIVVNARFIFVKCKSFKIIWSAIVSNLCFFFPQGNATLHLYPHFEPLRQIEGECQILCDYLTDITLQTFASSHLCVNHLICDVNRCHSLAAVSTPQRIWCVIFISWFLFVVFCLHLAQLSPKPKSYTLKKICRRNKSYNSLDQEQPNLPLQL